MRLATIALQRGTAAVVHGPVGFRVILSDSGSVFPDVGALLRESPDPMAAARRALGTGPLPGHAGRILRPVLEPGAVVCVGLNYRKHVLEMGRALPASPTYFTKLARSLTDPDADIEMPADSAAVDYEGELAVVIGADGRSIPSARAWDAVAGLTLLEDTSMRDWQMRSTQFFAGKAWESCTPCGPFVVTPDEFRDLGTLEISTRVNGVERQRAPVGDMIFAIADLVADLSRVFTLRPGDIIATGTPSGVGEATKSYLQHGDVVEVSFPGIGTLRNRFVRSV